MIGCLFPEHHKKDGGGPGSVALVLVLAVAVVAVITVRFVMAHLWWFAAPVAAAGAVRLGLAVFRFVRLDRAGKAHWCRARWHRITWKRLARNLDLGRRDKHRGGVDSPRAPKVNHPKARFRPDSYGWVMTLKTVPGTGRAELEKAADHLANAWKCQRVSVSQPKPGRLIVRGLRRDPLLEVIGAADIPPVRDLQHLYLGRDEHGTHRFADLANVPGICLGGMPGSGKSTEITSWLTQLAPSPAVQFALADGKSAGEFDDFADRAYRMAGDDLDQVVDLLEAQHTLMTDRLAAVRSVLGVKNAWHRGPSAYWPLVVTILDECQSYLDLTAVKGDKQLEPKVRRAIFLTSSLIRRGRSVMMLTVPATQKPTTDSLPSSIRDNCPISLCFGVKTIDAAAATLGTSIRDYPSYSPVTLADPAYAGCCTVTLKSGQDPFTRLRGPYVTEDQAAEVARASAHLRHDPRYTAPVVVPDDVSELVS